MRQIVTNRDMKRLDELTINTMGIPSMVLMERASMSFVDALLESDADLRRVLVVCGSGNNGGDGFAIARLLHMKGIRVETLFAGKEDHLTEEARQQRRIAANYRVPAVPFGQPETANQSGTAEEQSRISDVQTEEPGLTSDMQPEEKGQTAAEDLGLTSNVQEGEKEQEEAQAEDLSLTSNGQTEENEQPTTEAQSQDSYVQENGEAADGYNDEEADSTTDDSSVKESAPQQTESAEGAAADSRAVSDSRVVSDSRTVSVRETVSVSREPLDFSKYSVIVDALFGIGLSGTVREPYAEIIRAINQSGAFVAAVDIPSGLSGDTGRVQGVAVRADLTVTFACLKRGQLLYPGADYCGDLVVKDIGIYGKSVNSIYSLTENDLLFLSERSEAANKGTFGKVLAVTGSLGMSGAACMSAQAVLTAGAGMVMVQTVKENRVPIQTLVPEAIVMIGDDQKLWRDAMDWADVLLLGPGLGTGPSSLKRAEWFLSEAKWRDMPVVVDADGLNLMNMYPMLMESLPEHTVLTPHMGEFSRLTNLSVEKIRENPIGAAQKYAREYAVTLVLKDARTVIAGDGETYLNIRGNSGMATAGSGDVLAGILAGLMASERDTYTGSRKSMSLTKLAASGVLLHSLAGEEAAKMHGKRSMTAGKLLEGLEKEILRIE